MQAKKVVISEDLFNAIVDICDDLRAIVEASDVEIGGLDVVVIEDTLDKLDQIVTDYELSNEEVEVDDYGIS